MVSLEQVRLLEAKVARAIDYVERVTGENAVLREKMDSYQERIDELEVLVQRFKEDQGRIEDGILSALDRLNQFEDAIEKSLADRGVSRDAPAESTEDSPPAGGGPEESGAETGDSSGESGAEAGGGSGESGAEAGGDPAADLEPAEPEDESGNEAGPAEKTAEDRELDIF